MNNIQKATIKSLRIDDEKKGYMNKGNHRVSPCFFIISLH